MPSYRRLCHDVVKTSYLVVDDLGLKHNGNVELLPFSNYAEPYYSSIAYKEI